MRHQPQTPGRAPALPTLPHATWAPSPPAGLPRPPRPSCPSPSPTSTLPPQSQTSCPPYPQTSHSRGGAEPGHGDTFPQGQRDFSLLRIDFTLLPRLPRWAGADTKGNTPRERNPKLQTGPRPSPGGWRQWGGLPNRRGAKIQMSGSGGSNPGPPPPPSGGRSGSGPEPSGWAQAGTSHKCLICLIASSLSHNHMLSPSHPEIFPSPIHPSSN